MTIAKMTGVLIPVWLCICASAAAATIEPSASGRLSASENGVLDMHRDIFKDGDYGMVDLNERGGGRSKPSGRALSAGARTVRGGRELTERAGATGDTERHRALPDRAVSGPTTSTAVQMTVRVAGRPSTRTPQAGDVVVLSTNDAGFSTRAMRTIQIKRARSLYDTGVYRLVPAIGGRYLFAWRTVGLEPGDYFAEVQFIESGRRESARVAIVLAPRTDTSMAIAMATDLSLPFHGLNLEVTRRYEHGDGALVQGPLGLGWRLAVSPSLRRDALGLVIVSDVDGAELAFVESATGAFMPLMPGGALNRTIDGGYMLTSGEGERWRFGVDLLPQSREDKAGHRLTYASEAGRLSQMCDASAQCMRFTYGVDGTLTRVTDSTGRWVEYRFQERELKEVVVSEGKWAKYQYGTEHRLTSVTTPDGVHRYSYASDGRVTSLAGPGARADKTRIAQRFDRAGRPVAFTDQLGNSVAVDYDPHTHGVSSIADKNGHAWSFSARVPGQLSVTDPMGGTVIGKHDDAGRLTSLIDENDHERKFYFDDVGRPTVISYPDASTERFSYVSHQDGSLTVVRTTRGNRRITYTYSKRGLLTSKQVEGQSLTRYGHDIQGRVTFIEEDGKWMVFGYDPRGNVTRVVYPDGKSFTSEYDSANRRIAMTDPTGRKLQYGYRENLLVSIRDDHGELARFVYDKEDRMVRRSLGNGVTTTWTYDLASQVSRVLTTDKRGKVINDRRYKRDRAGNTTAKTDRNGRETYALDALDRLTEVSYASGAQEKFTLDPAGNRLEVTARDSPSGQMPASRIEYTVDAANKYTSIGGAPVLHDQDGNFSSFGGRTYRHDAEGRLVEVVVPAGRVVYGYDLIGRLFSRTDDRGTSRYYWDGDLLVLEEHEATGPTIYTWGAGLNELLSSEQGGRRVYFAQDANSNVDTVLSDKGTVLASYQFKPFGEMVQGPPQATTAIHWAGALYDSVSGLYHMRTRFYSPDLGRFVEPDPAGLDGGINGYTYVENSPNDWIDPSGLGFFKKIRTAVRSIGKAFSANPLTTILKATVLAVTAPIIVQSWSSAFGTAGLATLEPALAPLAVMQGYLAYRATDVWLKGLSSLGDTSSESLATTAGTAALCLPNPDACRISFAPAVNTGEAYAQLLSPGSSPAVVSEPSTLVLTGIGLATLAYALRRRRFAG